MASYNSFKRIDREAIVDGTVTSADIAPGAVNTAELGTDSVTSSKIANNSVGTDELNNAVDFSTKTITYRPIVNDDISGSANLAADKMASGAAEVNLGYTPLRANGTNAMSGRLAVTNGSASAPSIRGSDGNTGIYFADNEVRFTVNGSDAMKLDSSGRVSYPRKPAFAAVGQPGWLYSNSYGGTSDRELNSIMNWNLAHQYGGSNFSTGNGRFTAPVAGYYHFSTMWYFYSNNNSTNAYVHTFFRKNGSVNTTPSSRIPYNINMHGNTNNHDDGANYNSIQYMNASQYVSLCIRFHANGAARHHAGHQIFSGQLVG
jgi:hypothetical protein